MKTSVTKKTQSDFETVGYDDFFEDIFGLSLRGLKSIKTLFTDPADYFTAARHADWQDRFTPSMRLWLGLMTILIGLQFIWAGDTSNYMDTVTQMPRAFVTTELAKEGANIQALQDYDMLAAAKRINARNLLIYPFIFVAFFLLLSAIFRPWRNGENFIVSQRYMFGVIVPASVVGLISTIFSYFIPPSIYSTVASAQIAVVVALYVVTAYRGPMRDFGKDRLGMSLVMAMVIFAALFIAQIVSIVIASLPIIFEIGRLST
jgi:hypothetical protein